MADYDMLPVMGGGGDSIWQLSDPVSYDPDAASSPWNFDNVTGGSGGGGAGGVISEAGATGGSGGFDWSNPNVWGSLLSGAAGLAGALDTRKAGKEALQRGDPFGGWRGYYGQQLADLMKDPSSVTKMPGYQFQFDQGLQALTRGTAAGYRRSGNEAIALEKYGQDYASNYLQQQMQFLAGLAGSGIAPNFGAGMQGLGMGYDQASQALASIGYGVNMGMNRGGTSPAGTPGAYNPSSAGGEAATAGRTLSQTGSLLSKAGATNVGGYLSGAGGLVSGLARGGTGGYIQAGQSAANLVSRGASAAGASGVSAAAGTAGTYLGYAGAAYGLLKGYGSKKEGLLSGAMTGYQIGGPWGALAGGVLGYARAGGTKDLNPIGASGFSGIGMDTARANQNYARQGSNPAAALASYAGIKSDSVVGKLLDPSGLFSKHGDEKRNMSAFLKEVPVQDLGGGRYSLPNGLEMTKEQMQKVAGAWYGMVYHPDGKQDYWADQFQQRLAELYHG